MSNELSGFGLKYTKLGISRPLKFVSFIVLVLLILALSVIFSECNIFIIWSEEK